ncbi:glycoside hydrolase family 15 protein [Actinoplanes sp. NPDC049596]
MMPLTLPVVLTAALGLAAPGAPGIDEQYLPADKSGLLTSRTTESRVWATVQKEGGLGEIFYPTIGGPSARALSFVVTDGRGISKPSKVTTEQSDPGSLSFRQTFSARSWRLVAAYTVDPQRSTVLVDLSFSGRGKLYAVYDPALGNSRGGDSGRGMVATDGAVSSAVAASPAFTATSNGFSGVSDGLTDLRDGRMDWHYDTAGPGNLVQTGAIGHRHTTLAIGFADSASGAVKTAAKSLGRGFASVSRSYAYGWKQYLSRLKNPPRGLSATERQLYRTSAMVLAASEDKANPGAYVAAPAAPWAFGTDDPSGPYHLVWSRDLYQIALALIAGGDRAGANRALDFLFRKQQKPDGSFPQNSQVDGTPVWGGLQLDEVALPMVLAYRLGRTDASTWSHVKRAADFLLSYEQAPATPQERWENQSGYSPNTIATEIAGLVCAASIARANGDAASAARYLATADSWRARVKAWTVTSTGPYSSSPYFLRLTKDGDPNAGTTYNIGDSGPSNVDQRRVVDPSFLELVRLGVLPASDPDIRNSLRVIDAELGVRTPNGFFWHRASFDGFGEKADGSQWEYNLPDDSLLTHGRAWPLLSGERGDYEIAAGDLRAARTRLTAMARAAGPGHMLPEQVWDQNPPPGRTPGTPTYSATPLTWSHAQYIRLAQNLAAGRVLDTPDVVADRYLSRPDDK